MAGRLMNRPSIGIASSFKEIRARVGIARLEGGCASVGSLVLMKGAYGASRYVNCSLPGFSENKGALGGHIRIKLERPNTT